MASSFELLSPAGLAVDAVPDSAPDSAPGAACSPPWFARLQAEDGFRPDPRFGAPQPGPEDDGEEPVDAVLVDALADAERRGRDAALAEMAAEGARRAALKLSLQRLDAQLQEQLANRLAEAVAGLCESLLAPLAIDPEALQDRCLAAAAHIGEGIVDASLHLHPADIELLDPDFAATWHIVADPSLERGMVEFVTGEGAVRDGPAEWRAALREALGLG